MKQFLYLDTDIVTSIIAQKEKGYVIQKTEEELRGKENNSEKKVNGNACIESAGGFLGLLHAGAKLNLEAGLTSYEKIGNSTKDVAEKILHDAAFDLALKYIEPKSISSGDQSQDEEGNYLKLKRIFDYIDFDYIDKQFNQDGIIDYLKKNEAKQIQKALEEEKDDKGINRSQLRKVGTSLSREIKKAVATNNQEYDEGAAIIKAFRGLLPYDRMLISNDGYLIPLDNQYFRINPSSLGFKYGGEMTCVGMVTNIIGESTNPLDEDNFFATIQYTVNEALRTLLPTTCEDLCVIHPIAVYYGE